MENVDQQDTYDLKKRSTFLEEIRQLDMEAFEIEDLITLDQDAVFTAHGTSSTSTSTSCCSTTG